MTARHACTIAAFAALLSPTALTPLHAQQAPAPTPANATADSASAKKPADAAVAARISTLGLGLEISKLVNPNVAARVGLNSYSYSHTFNSNDIDYGGHLKLQSISALADLYPGKHTSFHATAGLLINNNKISASGKPNNGSNFTINGTNYSAAQVGSLDGSVTFPNKVAPYLGIGFGKPSEGGAALRFLFDLGVVFQGKPRLSLTASNPTNNPTLTSDVNAQRDKTQHDVDKFNVYPVISLGAAYHF